MSSSAPSVVFVINSLTAGGAERALVQIIAGLEDRLQGFATHLVLLDVEEERHAVPAFVIKHVLDAKFSWLKSTYLLTKLLKELSPTVTLSFLNRANCANIISSRLLNYRCIISERVHTSSHFRGGPSAAVSKIIVKLTYPLADQIIAVSQGVGVNLVTTYKIPERKVRVIYNPIDINRIRQQALESPAIALPDAYILGIGRLVRNKNFPLLIQAYQAANVPETLVILGEGPERRSLEALLVDLGLTDRVILAGYVDNPYPIIRAARAFVCSSNAEGFPNALIEAMALGCPVVSTDCESGPREILHAAPNRCSKVSTCQYGLLVPTNRVDTLAEAIATILRPEVSVAVAARGRERARDFATEASVAQYWSALAQYVERS